ncbi:tyrosine-protein kinase transmembrane receptor Ror-like isoform X3 [Periplaneta americana]|uniref:tyrosine-protein kinase transmembrane receptor Ror-like isoform X3 n=1 Tax=Periplaneta americana TaxID=6978 RepID=UPI0037E7DC1B
MFCKSLQKKLRKNFASPSFLALVGNTDVNFGGSTPHGSSGSLGPILSPPPGPHTFQPGHSLPPGGLPPGAGGLGGYGSSTDPVASPGTENADLSEKEGVCQVYRGTTCFKFVGNKTIYVPPRMTQRQLEDKLATAFMVITHSTDLTPRCESFAAPSLCYSTFPLCRDEDIDTTGSIDLWSKVASREPRRICRDDCEILENEICRTEYAIAKRHPLIGQQLALPECGDLPAVGSPDSENCLKLGIPMPDNIEPDEMCYTGRGESYRGTAQVTVSRHKCQPWSHQIFVKTSDHPELAGGHSFCRNPGEMEAKPWCFTEYYQREECDVPKCVDSFWLYITVSSAVLAFLLIFLISYWGCYKRRRTAGANSINRQLNGPGNKVSAFKASRVSSPSKGSNKNSPFPGGNNQLMEMNSLLPGSGSTGSKGERAGSSAVRAREYQLSHVRFLQELGEGAFGKVYKGEVNTGVAGEVPLLVAIKALKENATPKTQADFRREVELMTDLRHPNIVCLLGVVMKGEPLCMLFEYMTQGDLHEFLICHSPRSDVSACSDDGNIHVLEQPEFLHIALQIAAGMEYLSGHHYVHRDLAARNCLVGDNLTVKISDFGLSRDVYSSDYYRVQSKSLLPVRWMPPESILYGKFTTESDVWSYGVVLWEIYSYGLQPYYGYSNQEVIDMIRSRQLLPCPEDCPSRLYTLMIECWHEVPSRRPQFPEINSRLRSWWASSPNTCGYLGNYHSAGSPDVSSSNWTPPGAGVSAPGTFLTSGGGAASSYSGGSQKSSTGPSNKTGSTQLSVNISTPLSRPQPSPSMVASSSVKPPFNPALTQAHSQPNTPSHIQPHGPNLRGPSSSSMPNRQSPGSANQPGISSQPSSQSNTPSHIQHYQQGPVPAQSQPSPSSLVFHPSGKGQSTTSPDPSSPGPGSTPAEPQGAKQKSAQVQGTPKSSGGQAAMNSFGKSVGSNGGNGGQNPRQQAGSATNPAQLIVRLPPPYSKNGSSNVETKISNI